MKQILTAFDQRQRRMESSSDKSLREQSELVGLTLIDKQNKSKVYSHPKFC